MRRDPRAGPVERSALVIDKPVKPIVVEQVVSARDGLPVLAIADVVVEVVAEFQIDKRTLP